MTIKGMQEIVSLPTALSSITHVRKSPKNVRSHRKSNAGLLFANLIPMRNVIAFVSFSFTIQYNKIKYNFITQQTWMAAEK